MWLDRLMKKAPLLLVAWAASAIAGEAPLVLQGTAAYYGLRVPLAVQMQTRSADLSDLQVLNARGEPVPHAWVDEEPPTQEKQQQAVPFFKAPAAASAVDAAQQGGWILDLRKVKGALLELQLSVPPSEHGIYGFVLEYGDDTQRWHTYLGEAQLLSLQHQRRFAGDGRCRTGGEQQRRFFHQAIKPHCLLPRQLLPCEWAARVRSNPPSTAADPPR